MTLVKLISNTSVIFFGLIFLLLINYSSFQQVATLFCYFLSSIFLKLYLYKPGSRVDSIVVFYVTFTITIGLGAIVFSYNDIFLLHTLISGDELDLILDWYSFCMSLGLLVFIFSAFFLNSIRMSPFGKYHKIMQEKNSLAVGITFVTVITISLLGVFFEPGYLKSILSMFSGSITGGEIRKNITQSSSADSFLGKSFVTFVKYQLLPFISLVFLLKNRKHKIVMLAVVVMSMLLLSSEFRRGPLLFYTISLVVLYITNTVGFKKGAFFKYIYAISILITLMILMTYFLGRSQGLSFGMFFYELLYRLIFSQSQTGTYVFQIFPLSMPYQDGFSYLQNLPSFITGIDSGSLALEIFKIVHGRDGGASFSPFSEGYANFGIIGVCGIAIVLSGMLLSIDHRGKKMTIQTMEKCFYIYCLTSVIPSLAMGSIVGPVINILVIRLLIFLIRVLNFSLYSIKN